MYENKRQRLAPRHVFIRRLWKNLFISGTTMVATLLLGTAGYRFLAPCEWIDAFHNASMILSGMGPVVNVNTFYGKIFSSLYALFSGLVFVTNIGIILAPLFHRLLHQLHLDEE